MLQFLSKWIDEKPEFKNHSQRARMLLQSGYYKEALYDANKAIEYNQEKYYGYVEKARALCGLRQVEAAKEFLKSIRHLLGEDQKHHIDLTVQAIEKKQTQEDHQKLSKQLPQWYIDWSFANVVDFDENDFDLSVKLERNPAYVKFSIDVMNQINMITCDPTLLILSDPEAMIKKLQDNLVDLMRVYDYFRAPDKKPEDGKIIRHLIFSAPG